MFRLWRDLRLAVLMIMVSSSSRCHTFRAAAGALDSEAALSTDAVLPIPKGRLAPGGLLPILRPPPKSPPPDQIVSSPTPVTTPPSSAPSPETTTSPPKVSPAPQPITSQAPTPPPPLSSKHISPPPPSSIATASPFSNNKRTIIIVGAAAGGGALLILLLVLCVRKRHANRSRRGQQSGHLLEDGGVPKLNRSEIESACEEFSNVIGCSSFMGGTLYKGTLPNGAEITVLSRAVNSSSDWSSNLEQQFSRKAEDSSRLSHKNFLNLLGYCKEEEPFTRMLVFEYAPNGTLFEHLHVREAEHLDWNMRLRIIMGIAYCLNHMHKQNPPIIHENLTSYAISLSDDYAAKLSDFSIWNELSPPRGQSHDPSITNNSNSPESSAQDNVYRFGMILLECVTGRVPFSIETGSLEAWTLEYLSGEILIKELVDPLLGYYNEVQIFRISDVVMSCTYEDARDRPGMGEVCSRLKMITGIEMGGAAPRLSVQEWAELALRGTASTTSQDSDT